jgi:hypothetical protein
MPDGQCAEVPILQCSGTKVPVCFGDQNESGVDDACECDTSATPIPQMLRGPGGNDMYSSKNRYLSFEVGGPARNRAVMVSFTDLPVPFEELEGQVMWIGPVGQHGEIQHAATLQCEPHYTDVSGVGMLHVRHPAIVPGASYAVQVVDQFCGPALALDVTVPYAELGTSGWGDLVGTRADDDWTVSNGVVDFQDISAAVDAFRHLSTAPDLERADLSPAWPDGVVDFTDIAYVVEGFRGQSYPYGGTTACE